MAFEDLREHVAGTGNNARDYVEKTAEYYQLKAFKFLMQVITSFSRMLLFACIGFLAVLFLSIAASIALGQFWNNWVYGFLAIGCFYIAVGAIVFLKRDMLNRPILKKFSEYYFEK